MKITHKRTVLTDNITQLWALVLEFTHLTLFYLDLKALRTTEKCMDFPIMCGFFFLVTPSNLNLDNRFPRFERNK